MACNLTVGREKFRDVEEELRIVLARSGELRGQLMAAVDEDTVAYDKVSQAYKLPKGSDEEKAARSAAIQDALKYATEVPLKVAQAAMEVSQLALIALEKSNPNVASDARVARAIADAAREGATANVEINLGSITDGEFVERIRGEMEGLQG